jgi:hypothetical protein
MSRRLDDRLDDNLLVVGVRHSRGGRGRLGGGINRGVALTSCGRLLGVLLRQLVRRESLLDGDALVRGFFDGLLSLYLLVVRKVLEVLGVVVRFVRLCLGRRVEFLWRRI